MPLIGDFAGLKKLRSDIAGLGRPGGAGQRTLLSGVVREVRTLLREEFATGTGPDGSPWQKTARGHLALISRKLPQDFAGKVVGAGARIYGHIPWMSAHQDGHEFPARSVAKGNAETGKGAMHFSARGRLISRKKFGKIAYKQLMSGKKARFRTRFASAHTVGKRVLPQRLVYPNQGLTPRWSAAIGRGVSGGMARWYAGASR